MADWEPGLISPSQVLQLLLELELPLVMQDHLLVARHLLPPQDCCRAKGCQPGWELQSLLCCQRVTRFRTLYQALHSRRIWRSLVQHASPTWQQSHQRVSQQVCQQQ
jgi:hypothetical protein